MLLTGWNLRLVIPFNEETTFVTTYKYKIFLSSFDCTVVCMVQSPLRSIRLRNKWFRKRWKLPYSRANERTIDRPNERAATCYFSVCPFSLQQVPFLWRVGDLRKYVAKTPETYYVRLENAKVNLLHFLLFFKNAKWAEFNVRSITCNSLELRISN